MPRLYRNRYLTCFYCGRKNSTLYDGRTRRFDCPFCDATNYLDENGDITDPPVATDNETTPRQFAVARPFSPPSSPLATDAIFCATCLKNQHLLNASLAQYLPDPDDPDYAEREKGLYRFRRNQERLYPQICEQCEPKVRQRLEKAQYTAKADLLRRMLDRSAGARSSAVTRGWPERFDAAGKWLWIAGFVLQLGWHAVVMHSLLSQYFIWAEADDSLLAFRLLRICGPLVGSLPSDARLLGWSGLATIFGVWWSPRFSQIYRGFTRHISGVSKWYFFQAMAVVLRVCLPRIPILTTPDPAQLSTQAAAHAIAFSFAFLILILAPRSIHINMAPLFGNPKAQQPLREPTEPSSTSRHDETKTIADLLDEISRSPVSPTPPSPTPTDASSPTLPRRRTNALPMGHAHTQAAQNITTSLQEIDNLHLNLSPGRQQPAPSAWNAARPASRWSPPRSAPPDQQEMMDWSPTPAYRAFNTQGQRAAQPFGSAPTSDEAAASKPFWYRVPPAPTTPAQRVFNPPNQPRLRPSPVENPSASRQSAPLFGSARAGGQSKDLSSSFSSSSEVAFAEPRFFAEMLGKAPGVVSEDGNSDPRNELSGLFGQAFKLTEEEKRRQRHKEVLR
ncbi:Ima1 N-terminal domain-containing protein [Corynascus novoguineensis]|uniref:Ima1 N-terminal domain-containing protein n=1 Tax=Corynascus novoguineensis TaxID=1126955 RepID=A0AAN7CQD3_9PEZI|nr:Ima1 N-terminal domain-containing protein [Corynascus novoguineensis]